MCITPNDYIMAQKLKSIAFGCCVKSNKLSVWPQFWRIAPKGTIKGTIKGRTKGTTLREVVPNFTIGNHIVWIPLLLQILVSSIACSNCHNEHSGQFHALQNSVMRLENAVKELTQRLFETELRLQSVEECDCFKSCNINGSVHPEGSSWKQDCDICSCVRGEVKCRPIHCRALCKNPEFVDNECCPVCKKTCYLNGQVLQHGQRIKIAKSGTSDKCGECVCNDGKTTCKQIVMETMCPILDCPLEQQFHREDECCKFCAGIDFCSQGNDCHPNGTCHNLKAEYVCSCNKGFIGDGKVCQDINECDHKGGIDGHHCGQNTICVNTMGSYKCQCIHGFQRIDKYKCTEPTESSADLDQE